MGKAIKFWDLLAWIAFVIVVLYLMGRILGIINSPEILDMTALVSAAYFVGRYAMKIDVMFGDVENIKKDIKKIYRKCPIFLEQK